MKLDFSKIQSSGSDHIVVGLEAYSENVDKSALKVVVRLLCSRSGPVGADGVVLIGPRSGIATELRIFTPNGEEPDLCVNGILCAARYLDDASDFTEVVVQRGIRRMLTRFRDRRFPSSGFCVQGIEVTPDCSPGDSGDRKTSWLIDHFALASGAPVVLLSTGTPHAVIFVREIDERSLKVVGDLANKDRQVFPHGINVSLCRVLPDKKLFVRTFERGGAGLSLSCASASVAAVHAGIEAGFLDRLGEGTQVVTLGGLAIVRQLAESAPVSYSYSADVSRAFDASTLVSDSSLGPVVQGTAYFAEVMAYGQYRETQLELIEASAFVFGSEYV